MTIIEEHRDPFKNPETATHLAQQGEIVTEDFRTDEIPSPHEADDIVQKGDR